MNELDFICINIIQAKVTEDELLCQMAEEAAELAQAALKLRRAITGKNPTPVSVEDARAALLEEIADVELCEWALRISSDHQAIINKIVGTKLRRWVDRLEGAKNDN